MYIKKKNIYLYIFLGNKILYFREEEKKLYGLSFAI